MDGCLTDFDFSSAFLGPAPVWDKNLPSTLTDFQLEYMDLDEFLNENGIDEDIETPTMPSLLEDSPPKLISRLGIQPPSPQTSSNSSSQLSPPLPSISPAKVVVESVESEYDLKTEFTPLMLTATKSSLTILMIICRQKQSQKNI